MWENGLGKKVIIIIIIIIIIIYLPLTKNVLHGFRQS